MIDATRMTKLARAVAAWTLRCAHSGAALVGVAVLSLAAMQISRHGLEGLQPGRLAADFGLMPASAAERAEAEVAAEPPASPPQAVLPAMDGVVRYLSQTYRVSGTAVTPVVVAAQHAGRSVGVDPLLLIAVMAIESRFNPFAESSMGAQGLMQVMPAVHKDKLQEGEDRSAFLDPETNIRVGAQVLKESISRAGSVMGGLQRYCGNAGDPAQSYANKVMAEKQRLSQARAQSQRQSRTNMGA
jgi:soluble lytic murein transglycosylase-like protein